MRLHRAVIAALACYAALVVTGAALVAVTGWPRRFPDLALPLAGILLVAAGAAAIIAGRFASAMSRPLRELAAAAWSGVEGRLRPVHEPSREVWLDEVREAVAAFNAMALETSHTIAALEFRKSTLESVLA
ncbi:MAG TPA: hypothetical protein VGX97_07210, partial [bacterium]|nr:hypothetical protein [bacterium]